MARSPIAAFAAAVIGITSGAAVAAGSTNFIVLGDWGGQETPPFQTSVQTSVGDVMGKVADRNATTFNLMLGDNFYSHGISCEGDPTPGCRTDVHSHRFKDTFESVYDAPSLEKQPFYVLAGNHDHLGNVSAEIEYSHYSVNGRWRYPQLYYTFTQGSVQFVMIDTVVLAGGWSPFVDAVGEQPYHGPKGAPADHPEVVAARAAADSQLKWIESTLAASTAKWLIVCGHYPVWSVAEHGPTSYLVDNLKPLLEKYKATMYMNGHDHNLQHLNDGHGVDYIVSGSGHNEDNSRTHAGDVPSGSLKYFSEQGGFAVLSASDTSLAFDFVGTGGAIIHSFTRTDPRSA